MSAAAFAVGMAALARAPAPRRVGLELTNHTRVSAMLATLGPRSERAFFRGRMDALRDAAAPDILPPPTTMRPFAWE